jgi:integrase
MPTIKRMELSRTRVEKAGPRAGAYRIWDAKVPGLCLRILPSGTKTFEVHVDRNASVKLGRYPVVTLDAARTRAQARLGDFAKTGEHPRKRKIVTLADFLRDRYTSWFNAEHKNGQRNIDAIESQFADWLNRPLSEITAWKVEKYKAKRLKEDSVSAATVNRDLVRLKALVAKAVEWEALRENPLATVRRVKGEADAIVRYLTDAEEKALRRALDERDKRAKLRRASGNAWRSERGREALPSIAGYVDHLQPMVLLSLNTGMRRGELTSITWDDVDARRKVLTIRGGYSKAGKARHIPLNAEALEVLKRYRKQHSGEGRIFPVHSVKKSWGQLLTKAKISSFRWHDLRHSFASRLVMKGVDLNTVRELLGHSDLKMTLRYAHLAPEHKAAAVDKLIR